MSENFKKALEFVLKNEGGYVNDPDDPGGETYKGIARNMWPDWAGWAIIDKKHIRSLGIPQLQELVEEFYYIKFWKPVGGDNINNLDVAISIFDFAVNAGIATSVSLAQVVVGVDKDGIAGDNTVNAINGFDPDHFLAAFTVAKIARYVSIINKRPASRKYLFGWVRRALNM